jgi:hypothetical protein
MAPEEIAPLCFPLAAQKKLIVAQVLDNGRWMRGLQHIKTEEQLEQFVNLWTTGSTTE